MVMEVGFSENNEMMQNTLKKQLTNAKRMHACDKQLSFSYND